MDIWISRSLGVSICAAGGYGGASLRLSSHRPSFLPYITVAGLEQIGGRSTARLTWDRSLLVNRPLALSARPAQSSQPGLFNFDRGGGFREALERALAEIPAEVDGQMCRIGLEEGTIPGSRGQA